MPSYRTSMRVCSALLQLLWKGFARGRTGTAHTVCQLSNERSTTGRRLGRASNDVRKVAARLEAVSQVDTGSCREIVQTPSTAINIAIRRRVASCTANLFLYPASAFSRCQLFLGVAGRWQGRGVEWSETKAALGSRYLPLRHREVAPCTVTLARGAHAVVESCTVALSSRGASCPSGVLAGAIELLHHSIVR